MTSRRAPRQHRSGPPLNRQTVSRCYAMLGYFRGSMGQPLNGDDQSWLSGRLLCRGYFRLNCGCSGTIAIGPESVSRSVQNWPRESICNWSGSSQIRFGRRQNWPARELDSSEPGESRTPGSVPQLVCKRPNSLRETPELVREQQRACSFGLGGAAELHTVLVWWEAMKFLEDERSILNVPGLAAPGAWSKKVPRTREPPGFLYSATFIRASIGDPDTVPWMAAVAQLELGSMTFFAACEAGQLRAPRGGCRAFS